MVLPASYFRFKNVFHLFHALRKSKLWYTIFIPHIFLVLYEALWYEHSSRDARAYSWNMEKLYTFYFLKKPFFIVKSGWLIHFSHSFGVFALVLISVTFHCSIILRGTQRKFSENICSEDDLRSRIFRSICCKIFCLPISPRIFEHQKMV